MLTPVKSIRLHSLKRLNSHKFRKLNSSRRELYEKLDKPALKPLPARRYEYAHGRRPPSISIIT
jgi:hypothetical protein